jgi:pyridoxine 5-phosphate synthase
VKRIGLGVNVDHVATLRQARGTSYPDPLEAALAAERGGAEGITVHLREDRRHIQDEDVRRIHAGIATKLNLEMAADDAIVEFACALVPDDVCLVPERREELTTEGGLAVAGHQPRLTDVCSKLADAGIAVSLFIDPDLREIEAAAAVGAPVIEIHTGTYADAANDSERAVELNRIREAAERAERLGMQVNGGHGLTTENVGAIAAVPQMVELNIGHFLVGRAVITGIEQATREMLAACLRARND